MRKLVLDESRAILVEEDLPAVELSGPIQIEEPVEEPVPEEVETNAYKTLITNLIQQEWNSIDDINTVIATLTGTEYEELSSILSSIVDEKTIQIGMLTKASELIDNSDTNLMNIGLEKAEDIVSEPASKDLE